MANFKCNSCLMVYPSHQADDTAHYHTCAPVTNPLYQPDPAKPDYDGRQTIERAGHRDERVEPGFVYLAEGEGLVKAYRESVHPEERTRKVFTLATHKIRKEGTGRTAV
jgi:hypothetical protein